MKKWLALLLTAVMLLILTGCWDRREMNTLGIIMGLGIDQADNGLKVTAQVVIPAGVSSNTGKVIGSPITVYSQTAPTLFEAIQKLTLVSPRMMFLSHIRVLVLSEEFASHVGIGDIMESMVRDPMVRPDYYVMIARNTTAETILSTLTALDKISANKLYNSLEQSSKTWAPTTVVNADRLFEHMISSGISPVVTGVQVMGDPKAGSLQRNVETSNPGTKLIYTGIGVFKKDKLIGWLNEDESKGFNYIRDNVRVTVGHVNCSNKGKIALRHIKTSSKMKAEIRQSIPSINIHVKVISTVASVECDEQIGNIDVINRLQRDAESKIINLMKKAVESVSRKYKVDIFGFGEEINRTNPKLWKQLESQWNEKLAELKVNYTAEYEIKQVGTLDDSFQSYIKE
ncbi:Ger(x)C family spore germination protein [Paenibacillus sp. GCM10012307]|uniref:Ger(X)C family spore germination protein n=1 Tax=Paenibacillus roseus TaxID=2798579 RepID=A0A934IWE5_9BACL|nr:Ger(x)C family spore germination protein [Paenibacillus roseus]MBJ6360541.1 Ger(x)C family spore germination protein [Paenibacillus roseus]